MGAREDQHGPWKVNEGQTRRHNDDVHYVCCYWLREFSIILVYIFGSNIAVVPTYYFDIYNLK